MASVRCVACGADNPAGSLYCRRCARKLDEDTRRLIESQRVAAVQNQTTGIRWTVVIVTGLVIVVLAALVLGVLVIH